MRFLRALTLVCAVFATSVAPGGWLVCLGADGHFALEAAVETCSDEHCEAESASAPCSMKGCGPCLDAVLGGAAVLRPDTDLGSDVSLGLVVLPHVTSASGLDVAVVPCSLPAQSSHLSIFARHLQSTLLRI